MTCRFSAACRCRGLGRPAQGARWRGRNLPCIGTLSPRQRPRHPDQRVTPPRFGHCLSTPPPSVPPPPPPPPRGGGKGVGCARACLCSCHHQPGALQDAHRQHCTSLASVADCLRVWKHIAPIDAREHDTCPEAAVQILAAFITGGPGGGLPLAMSGGYGGAPSSPYGYGPPHPAGYAVPMPGDSCYYAVSCNSARDAHDFARQSLLSAFMEQRHMRSWQGRAHPAHIRTSFYSHISLHAAHACGRTAPGCLAGICTMW